MKRRIRSERAFEFPGGSFGVPLQGQDNAIGSGAGGVRLMPVAGLRISFDAEVGRADRPLTPVSDRKFHNESARVQWRRKNLLLSGRFKSRVNANPASPIDYSSAGRSWGFSGSWSDAAARLTLDAGYIKIGLKTTAGIYNFFDLGRGAAPARALYASNLHTVNFGARIAAHERLTLYAGYALSKDTADGSAAASFPDRFTPAYPNFRFEHGKTSNFYNSFPLTYHAPQARVSLKVRGGLEWNAGWQYYGYGERFTALQGYRAHVGYTKLALELPVASVQVLVFRHSPTQVLPWAGIIAKARRYGTAKCEEDDMTGMMMTTVVALLSAAWVFPATARASDHDRSGCMPDKVAVIRCETGSDGSIKVRNSSVTGATGGDDPTGGQVRRGGVEPAPSGLDVIAQPKSDDRFLDAR